VATLALALLLAPLVPEAQPPTHVHRIGVLTGTTREQDRNVKAFLEGMRTLGYVEGQHLVLEYRGAAGQHERLPTLAAELVQLRPEVIVTQGTPAALAAKQATTTIPIVFTGGDPVRGGLVASLARPGGNVTGLSDSTVDVDTKRLELLKEIVPTASRVAILWNRANPTNPLQLKDTQAAAPRLSMSVYPVEVREVDDLERAFAAIRKDGAAVLLVPGDPMFFSQQKQIMRLAAKNRLPAMYATPEAAQAGGLIGYGTNLADLARRAAIYVDRILKGAKPADLPVEQPTKFELVINLKTAKALGLTIPPSLLLRADQVVE